MNADKLVSRVRDWLNSWVSDRSICVHLRSSAAKIPYLSGRAAKSHAVGGADRSGFPGNAI